MEHSIDRVSYLQMIVEGQYHLDRLYRDANSPCRGTPLVSCLCHVHQNCRFVFSAVGSCLRTHTLKEAPLDLAWGHPDLVSQRDLAT